MHRWQLRLAEAGVALFSLISPAGDEMNIWQIRDPTRTDQVWQFQDAVEARAFFKQRVTQLQALTPIG
ncbi:hypothetical protein [Pseudoroseomonas ludipueritiae]|uniref:Uncharacterized protein n=1 Tax=Pseudoroseomonas ludipueritiae TaxID=198093 RepID=A0ABR7R802_9PROT|nr:hypothetical protein [Pseudoroseomonas ludipueritiae]MBC9177808.1 hypothetical protein [Pseudoroseomonas ludipueritiae]MCG7363152.1 hypothetical protein [Roseomonas sp. ACRSG]